LINGLSCGYLPIVITEESEFVVMESIIKKAIDTDCGRFYRNCQ